MLQTLEVTIRIFKIQFEASDIGNLPDFS
jgi:hypothetical protein